ncbi:MAG: hypothetical protein JWM09_299 [Francisellaceae bacterium]|nr:hypothetical protein [Francisellaceae bacterium]
MINLPHLLIDIIKYYLLSLGGEFTCQTLTQYYSNHILPKYSAPETVKIKAVNPFEIVSLEELSEPYKLLRFSEFDGNKMKSKFVRKQAICHQCFELILPIIQNFSPKNTPDKPLIFFTDLFIEEFYSDKLYNRQYIALESIEKILNALRKHQSFQHLKFSPFISFILEHKLEFISKLNQINFLNIINSEATPAPIIFSHTNLSDSGTISNPSFPVSSSPSNSVPTQSG